ncbi:MAG: DUF2314 domain-containing protein [Comamonas sp.]|nr:DUF2314 domain-containing protein [Comamonas sp.]
MVSYTLDNGETLHAQAPDTFYLPPGEMRAGLNVGDFAKLVFRVTHEAGENVERMWVIVQARQGAGYLGTLDNQPYCTEALAPGLQVAFGPEHVIQILRGD